MAGPQELPEVVIRPPDAAPLPPGGGATDVAGAGIDASATAGVDPWANYGAPTLKAPAAGRAAGGDDPWKVFGAPATPVGGVEDILRGSLAGLEKGAIGLAGAPGTLAEVGQQAVDYLAPPPKGIPRVPVAERLPNARNIRKSFEETQGAPIYEAKTPLGKLADETSQFVPGAVMFGTGATGAGRIAAEQAKNVGKFAVAPAAAGEVAEAVAPEPLRPYAKVAGQIAGGGVAGATLTTRSAEKMVRDAMPEYVNPRTVFEAGNLMRDARDRGLTLTWPEALSQVTGQDVLLDVQRFLESSGRTGATMKQRIGNRAEQVRTAAGGEIDRLSPRAPDPNVVGPQVGRSAEEAVNDARDIINQGTEAFYRAAEGQRLTAQEYTQARAFPGWNAARDAIRGDPQLDRYVSHLPDDSVGFLNEVKKYLGQQAENATQPVTEGGRNMQRAAGFSADTAGIRQLAIDASRRATGPGGISPYEMALNIQEQTRRLYLEPLMQGPLGRLAKSDLTTQRAIEALFPKGGLVEDAAQSVSTAVAALSVRNPAATRALVRAYAEKELDAAFNAAGMTPEAAQFAGARFSHGVSGSPVTETQRLANLRAAIESLPNGQQVWPGFERMLEAMSATGMRQRPGSKTAFNQEIQQETQTGGAIGNVAKLALSPSVWLKKVDQTLGRWQGGRNLDQLADILTDQRAQPILARLSQMPAHSPEGQFLLARLVAIGETARKPSDQPKSATK